MSTANEIVLVAGASVPESLSEEIETIVRQYAGFVYQVAFAVLRNHHDAEDVAQETFIRVMRQRKRLQEVRNMRAWLARICWRLALNKRQERNRLLAKSWHSPKKQQSVNPEKLASSHEMLEVVQSLIDSLPEELKNPLVLSTVEGMSSTEISQVLDIPDPTVRTRILRARKMLQQKLEVLTGGDL